MCNSLTQKYIKRLLWIYKLCIKEIELYIIKIDINNVWSVYKLLEKLNNKRSEVKHLISFRKRNQKRFYD